ncbi:hypothetical protein QYF36_019608 [Acer negundo]|nr:hypothetical protein QYF36_019608 [Acer negundo]
MLSEEDVERVIKADIQSWNDKDRRMHLVEKDLIEATDPFGKSTSSSSQQTRAQSKTTVDVRVEDATTDQAKHTNESQVIATSTGFVPKVVIQTGQGSTNQAAAVNKETSP